MEFNKAYNRQEFVHFLQHSFLPEDFLPTEEPVTFQNKMTHSTQAIKLGTSTELDLVVYEVRHTSKNDARVSLSKDAFRMLADETEDRALVIFVPEDNNDNYRFSLIEITLEGKDDSTRVTRNYSNPHRYSYFLGKGIAYYTPNKYLNEKGRVINADDLRSRFSVEVLTKEFYNELSDWYAWAIKIIRFPNALNDKKDDDKYNNESAIRLITRLIFVWFLKQRHLIPDEFFDERYIADNLLKDFEPNKKDGFFEEKSLESRYYKAILQNLFFAMLNSPITSEGKTELSERRFRNGRKDYGNNKLMRYECFFKNPQLFVDLANQTVPFLNGGLFDCLDNKDNDIYYDCFTDRREVNKFLVFPDFLFFGEEAGKNIDLSEWYGDKKKKKVSARGIIDILKRYNFTVEENTPFDQEVSLDPELLGKVFENLLASYNPETQTTARKQTGSFYTPREIVQYMVNESLVAHLKRTVGEELEPQFRQLLQYSDDPVELTDEQRKSIMQALYNCKILDPACGSGAFPMGILQQMVHILQRIDNGNDMWKEMMLSKAITETSEAYRTASSDERKEMVADIERSFDENINRPDYARKLYLIENCIYGVDIQPIAIQISKLRFFISLVVDQKTNNNPADNFGIRPLPNLEAKFVAANTLIGLNSGVSITDTDKVCEIKAELKTANHKIFGAKTAKTKHKYEEKLKELRISLAEELNALGFVNEDEAQQLASWDMFNQNTSSSFFDPDWMFGVKDGFDIVIGNPPYISAIDLKKSLGDTNYKYLKSLFQTSKGTVDMYVYFFEKGLGLLCNDGILSFITPNKYLSANYGKALRAYLMANAKIITVLDVSRDSIFDADTYPVVSIICKFSNVATYEFITVDKYKIEHKFSSSQLSELPENNWGFILSTKYELTKKVLLKSKPMLDVCKINATSTASEADKFHDTIYNDEKIGLKLINTGTIDPYCNFWGNRNLTDKGALYLYPMLPNNTKILGTNRYHLYNNPKIIIAKMSLCLEGFFDEKGEYASINTNCLHCITINPLKLMGWIHSKLFHYIYECYFEGLRMAGNYLPFTAPYLSCMCVPLDIDSLEIEDLVNSILFAKHSSPDADTSMLEQKIDLLVYRLYGLTYDEVLIIDPQTPIIREEYETQYNN